MSTCVDHRVRAQRAADRSVARTGFAAVAFVVAGVLLWGSPQLRPVGMLCFVGAFAFTRALRGALRQRRRLPAVLAAQSAWEDVHRRGWRDAQVLDHALRTRAVMTEQPAEMLVLDPDERVHVRVVATVSLSHAPVEPVEIALTTRALVTVFPDGHLARWDWSTATGLRIDLARWRIDLYWSGTGDPLHIHGPHVPVIAVYAAHQVWTPEQCEANPQMRRLRGFVVAAHQVSSSDPEGSPRRCV